MLVPNSSLLSSLPRHIDVFVCSVSYEERSLKIPELISPSDVDAVIVYGDENTCGEKGRANKTRLMQRFSEKASFVPVDIDDPLSTADNMLDSVIARRKPGLMSYVVDITTFTHETLLIFLRILQRSLNPADTNVITVYSLASEYSLGSSLHEKWLTKGVKEVRSILGYLGNLQPTLKPHLIVLAGLETDRATKVIEMYEPTVLSVGWGEPDGSVRDTDLEVFKTFHRHLVDKYKGVMEFRFSCLDPLTTKSSIEEQIARAPGFNAIIAPMNTKVSTVGVALAAFQNDLIQLCYAPVEQYNMESYSKAGNECYVFEIPLRTVR